MKNRRLEIEFEILVFDAFAARPVIVFVVRGANNPFARRTERDRASRGANMWSRREL